MTDDEKVELWLATSAKRAKQANVEALGPVDLAPMVAVEKTRGTPAYLVALRAAPNMNRDTALEVGLLLGQTHRADSISLVFEALTRPRDPGEDLEDRRVVETLLEDWSMNPASPVREAVVVQRVLPNRSVRTCTMPYSYDDGGGIVWDERPLFWRESDEDDVAAGLWRLYAQDVVVEARNQLFFRPGQEWDEAQVDEWLRGRALEEIAERGHQVMVFV